MSFQPSLLPRGRWSSILAPGNVIAALIERRQAIEGIEFKSFLDSETRTRRPHQWNTAAVSGHKSVMSQAFARNPGTRENIKVPAVGPGKDWDANYHKEQT